MTEPATQRDAIRNLQRYLRRISYEENDLLPIPIDGIFGSRTEEAVLEFQRMKGLPATGRVDRTTWELLFAEYDRLTREVDRIEMADLFPKSPARYVTSPGEESSFILLLQWMLRELGVLYDELGPIPRSGIMDEETARAVAILQSIHRLPVTGQVDRNTWNRLLREYERIANSASLSL